MDPVDGASIGVEVVYSPCAGEFDCVRVRLPVGATVGDAVRLSGMPERHAGLGLEQHKLGIWGKRRGLDDLLRDGDRVEIYRPLMLDPKEARRQRQRGQAGSATATCRIPGATGNRTR